MNECCFWDVARLAARRGHAYIYFSGGVQGLEECRLSIIYIVMSIRNYYQENICFTS